MRNIRKDTKKSQKHARGLRKNMSEAEHRLWLYVRKKQLDGFRIRRQHPIGPYIADFVCVAENLIIEVDGETHSTEAELTHDNQRTHYLESQSWRVIRYSNEDVFRHIDNVLEDIFAYLKGEK